MKKLLLIGMMFFTFFGFSKAFTQETIGKFSTTDVNGKSVTEEIFSKADVTVLNIWGTFCGPCVREMPELGEWAKKMPKSVQLAGLIVDVNSSSDKNGIKTAKNILDKSGASFTNLIANNDFMNLLKNVQFVPTTFIVDKEGKIIGKAIIGADVAKYKAAVEDYLNGKK